jgi:hypothetical protein
MTTKFLSFLLATVLLVGCSNESTTPPQPAQEPAAQQIEQSPTNPTKIDQTFTHTITTDTEYYLDGPQQARPPEGKMKAGTKVKVVEEAGSYWRVKSEDGLVGFVAADSLKAVQAE